jgi:HSP20 family protein
MTLPGRRSPNPLARWDPLREFDELQARMSRLMGSVFGSGDEPQQAIWTPLADVTETADAFLVDVDLPGVRADEVTVEATGNELIVSGEFKVNPRDGAARSRGRRVGRFEYRTTLPQNADVDRISAELNDGILTIRIPKREAAKSRRVTVNTRQ